MREAEKSSLSLSPHVQLACLYTALLSDGLQVLALGPAEHVRAMCGCALVSWRWHLPAMRRSARAFALRTPGMLVRSSGARCVCARAVHRLQCSSLNHGFFDGRALTQLYATAPCRSSVWLIQRLQPVVRPSCYLEHCFYYDLSEALPFSGFSEPALDPVHAYDCVHAYAAAKLCLMLAFKLAS